MNWLFIEVPKFISLRDSFFDNEDDFRSFQIYLAENHKAGDVIKGAAPLRKIRWSGQNRGKRGGCRIIYFPIEEIKVIFLIYLFPKNVTENLSSQDYKVLSQLTGILKKEALSDHFPFRNYRG